AAAPAPAALKNERRVNLFIVISPVGIACTRTTANPAASTDGVARIEIKNIHEPRLYTRSFRV
ncbi:MAG: hypothetical protein ABIT83_07410, partial [Massilia sp.]